MKFIYSQNAYSMPPLCQAWGTRGYVSRWGPGPSGTYRKDYLSPE